MTSQVGAVRSTQRAMRNVMRHEQARTWLALAPALAIVIVLFCGAVVLALVQSFGLLSTGIGRGPSISAYLNLFSSPEFGQSVRLTAYVAVVSTVLSVTIGVGAALLLRRLGHGRRIATTIFQLNLPIPHLIGATAILATLGQSGFIARIATRTGLLDGPADFPAMVFDPWAIGVIAQYVWKEIPFVGVVTLAVLRNVGDKLDEAARMLGASGWQRFRHVTLPLLVPGVLPVTVIVFAFTFGTFEVPLLLGRSFPAVLPVLAHQRYTATDLASRPEAMAISVVITVFILVVVFAGMALVRNAIRRDAT